MDLTVRAKTFYIVKRVNADTLIPGVSVANPVLLVSYGGFSSPVMMALDSIRPSTPTVSISFDPNPVTPPPNGSRETQMKVTTQPGTPLGNYTIHYHGERDSVVRKQSVNLVVVPEAFVLTGSPRNQVAHRWCESKDYSLLIMSRVSYSYACTLSAAVDPPGSPITVGFLPDGVVVESGARTMRVQPGEGLSSGPYVIKVQARSGSAVFTVEDTLVYAVTYFLGPALPNPSRGSRVISYGLPVESPVSLKVYDLSGRLVRILVFSTEKAGYHKVSWDGRAEGGRGVSTGVYFYRLTAGSFSATRKLVVLK
jgi:hypothetical protein